MACGEPTETLFTTLTTTTIGDLTTLTTNSLSTDVISGRFPSSIDGTLTTLAFTYTTVATNPIVLTTRPIVTTTQAVPTRTILQSCVTSQTTLPGGSVSVSSIYITVGGNGNTNGTTNSDTSTNSSTGSSNKGAIIGGVIAGVAAVAILILIIWVLWRRNRKMSKQIKENEEEEKRNDAINVDQLLPSPYTQYPPSFAHAQESPGYAPSSTDAYRQSAASPTSGSHILSPTSQYYADHAAAAHITAGVAIAATTQYTPTHSRDGSFSTQAPRRPSSTVPSGIDQQHLPISPHTPADGASSGQTAGSSAKAREAFQSRRRSALYAQNSGEGEEDDIIMPENATAVRSTVPPSAWGMPPPPAYSPGDQ